MEPFGAQVYPALYRDLAERPEAVREFFPLAPEDPAAWARQASVVDAGWGGARGEFRRAHLVTALGPLHERLGATLAQRANLRALAEPGSLVVVTGQQAGLLGGPLYTLYKALGAVLRADAAARALGRPVLPVFWVASEDHDWSEVSQVGLVAPAGELVHLRLAGKGDGRSAGSIPVPPEARHLVGELESLYPPTAEGAPVLAGLLEGLRQPRQTLAGWFTWQLHRLLGSRGLLFFDPMLPALRTLGADVLAGAPQRAPDTHAMLAERAQALRAAGYAPGLELPQEHMHVFAYVDGRRLGLHVEGGRVRSADGRVDCSPEELARLVRERPTDFSPNVVLRPLVQNWCLPVLCQLGGPGEIAYLAQLGPVFEAWGQQAPPVGPRPGATFISNEDRRALERAGVELAELRQDLDAVLERVAGAGSSLDLDALFAEERRAVAERYGRLETILAEVGPGMPQIVGRNADHVRHQLEYLERKAHQHRRRAARAVVGRLRATAARLFPASGLQERFCSAYPHLLQRGPSWLDELQTALASAPGPFGTHWLLEERA